VTPIQPYFAKTDACGSVVPGCDPNCNPINTSTYFTYSGEDKIGVVYPHLQMVTLVRELRTKQ
jgi:hypothetical protein